MSRWTCELNTLTKTLMVEPTQSVCEYQHDGHLRCNTVYFSWYLKTFRKNQCLDLRDETTKMRFCLEDGNRILLRTNGKTEPNYATSQHRRHSGPIFDRPVKKFHPQFTVPRISITLCKMASGTHQIHSISSHHISVTSVLILFSHASSYCSPLFRKPKPSSRSGGQNLI